VHYENILIFSFAVLKYLRRYDSNTYGVLLASAGICTWNLDGAFIRVILQVVSLNITVL
jgi:hypothetical protein